MESIIIEIKAKPSNVRKITLLKLGMSDQKTKDKNAAYIPM